MTFDQRIYNQSIADGIPGKLAELIVAQARYETENYTSNVFLHCNNCFGYKWVGQSTATGPCSLSPEGDYYAGYSNIEQSVSELTAWIKRRQAEGIFPANLSSISNAADYATVLKNGQFYGGSVTNYTNGLLYWLSQLPPLAFAAGSRFIILILAVAAFAYRKSLFGKKARKMSKKGV